MIEYRIFVVTLPQMLTFDYLILKSTSGYTYINQARLGQSQLQAE